MTKRILRLFFIGLLCSAAFACSTSNTLQRSGQPGYDYNQYRTYRVGKTIPPDSENPAFRWPQLSERIQKELHFLLPSVGLDRTMDSPDLYIFVYVIADSQDRSPPLTYQVGWRAEPFLSAGERFSEYGANTLVLDFVDPRLNELVWRGSTHLPFDNESETYKKLSERLTKLVRRYPNPPSQQ